MFDICIIGLGKIGLPLAVQCALKGKTVIGCDIQIKVVDAINKGSNPIKEEPGLAENIKMLVREGKLKATTNTIEAVSESKTVIIIVPLVVDDEKKPDYSIIEKATATMAGGLKKGTLVVFETTLPVGSTRNRLGKLIESRSGLRPGKDFYLAFSPERVYSGRILKDLATYPKIVGGIDEKSSEMAKKAYSEVLDVPIIVLTAEEAEYSKLADMTYRDVNIALANEFAKYAREKGLDVLKVIEAANSQPFSRILMPGIGVGGHCAPVYPYFLINDSKSMKLALAARQENDDMAEYLILNVEEKHGKINGKEVLIIGLAYRPNVKEDAFSTTKLIIKALKKRGCIPIIYDPLFNKEETLRYADYCENLYSKCHKIIITQAVHDKNIDWKALAQNGTKILIDGRNDFDRREIEKFGISYFGVGR